MNADQTALGPAGDGTERVGAVNTDRPVSSPEGDGSWRVGDVVEGLYEVRDEITAGAMGLVYRVHHQGWNIDLAVKTPRPELVSSPQRVTDFETEAQTWVELGLHPHVVACVYVRRLDGLPRVFAEWVDGGSLHDAISGGRLYAGTAEEVLARILDVAIQFAWGLDYAHSRGLVHQDVKPRNVMVSADWMVKVTDFGLAKARAVAGDTATTAAEGSVLAGYSGYTPAYCSPEQASAAATAETGGRPDPLTRATDVWSWAIGVWEMFAGEPPCARGQAAAEAFAEFRADPWVDNPAIPAMPDPIADLLARCLDPEPATRPRRIGELADQLAGLYQQLVEGPYPRTKPEPAKLVADGLNNNALSMLDLGRADEAEQLWRRALEADPQHLPAVYNYGLHRWRSGGITDADLVSQLETVRASQPGPAADRLLAQVHVERCDTATARTLLAEAGLAAPDDQDIAALAAVGQQADLAEPRAFTVLEKFGRSRSVAVNADASIAVFGIPGKKLRVQVWDLHAGRRLRTLTARRGLGRNSGSTWAVALSADGRTAVSGGADEMIRVWDVTTGRCRHTLPGHLGGVKSVALSADGRTGLSCSDGEMRVWDLTAGACMRTITGTGMTAALSADGRVAISTSGRQLKVWDVAIGQCTRTFAAHESPAFTPGARVKSVAISGDGRIAVSGGADRTVRVWDLRTGACLHTLTVHVDVVNAVAISGDGRIAISGGEDGPLRVWDVHTGRCLRSFYPRTWSVEAVAMSVDGRTAVSAGVKDWNLGDERDVWLWDVPTAPGRLAEWCYVQPRSALDLIEAAARVEAAADRAEALIAAADGLAAADQLRVARAVAGYERDPRLVELWRQLGALGRPCGLRDVWLKRTLAFSGLGVDSVAVSADGNIAAVCGISVDSNDAVQVWDLSTGQCLYTGTDLRMVSALSARGQAGESDRVKRITGDPYRVAISADGRVAVTGDVSGARLWAWDLSTGKRRRFLTQAKRFRLLSRRSDLSLVSLDLSADGRIAISGDETKVVHVWDVITGQRVATLPDRGAGRNNLPGIRYAPAVLSGDGTVVVTCNASHVDEITVHVWALDWDYEFGADDLVRQR